MAVCGMKDPVMLRVDSIMRIEDPYWASLPPDMARARSLYTAQQYQMSLNSTHLDASLGTYIIEKVKLLLPPQLSIIQDADLYDPVPGSWRDVITEGISLLTGVFKKTYSGYSNLVLYTANNVGDFVPYRVLLVTFPLRFDGAVITRYCEQYLEVDLNGKRYVLVNVQNYGLMPKKYNASPISDLVYSFEEAYEPNSFLFSRIPIFACMTTPLEEVTYSSTQDFQKAAYVEFVPLGMDRYVCPVLFSTKGPLNIEDSVLRIFSSFTVPGVTTLTISQMASQLALFKREGCKLFSHAFPVEVFHRLTKHHVPPLFTLLMGSISLNAISRRYANSVRIPFHQQYRHFLKIFETFSDTFPSFTRADYNATLGAITTVLYLHVHHFETFLYQRFRHFFLFTEKNARPCNRPVDQTYSRALQYGPKGDMSKQLAYPPRCFRVRPIVPLKKFLAIVQRVTRQDPIFRHTLVWPFFRKGEIHKNFLGMVLDNGNLLMCGQRGIFYGCFFITTMPTLLFSIRDLIRKVVDYVEYCLISDEILAYGDDMIFPNTAFMAKKLILLNEFMRVCPSAFTGAI